MFRIGLVVRISHATKADNPTIPATSSPIPRGEGSREKPRIAAASETP